MFEFSYDFEVDVPRVLSNGNVVGSVAGNGCEFDFGDGADIHKSTGRPPDINLHQKSAPKTNSKAISLWARGGGMF